MFTLIGIDGNNLLVTESNGDRVIGPELGELWPAELDAGHPSSLSLEEKTGLLRAEMGEEINMMDEGLEEVSLVEQPLKEKNNCERLSPQSQLEDSDADPATLETIFIAPLDGSQAELRSQLIKEVRKPGRSKYEPL